MGNYYKAFLPLLSLKTAWFGNKQKKIFQLRRAWTDFIFQLRILVL